MNNIYVDELPKICDVCPCLNDDIEQGCHCNLGAFDCDDGFKLDKRHQDCPLKPLTDRLAEERKSVVQEIRDIAKKISRPTTEYDDNEFDYEIDAVEFDNLLLWFEDGKQDFIKTYLDQIERGE